jgi:hypothetical protein
MPKRNIKSRWEKITDQASSKVREWLKECTLLAREDRGGHQRNGVAVVAGFYLKHGEHRSQQLLPRHHGE